MPSNNQAKIQRLSLTCSRETDWRQTIPNQINTFSPGLLEVDCKDWRLGCSEIKRLTAILQRGGLKICRLYSTIPETIVSASALGHQTHLTLENQNFLANESEAIGSHITQTPPKLIFHEGTLRSGDHLTAEGDLLVLGNVNPGARVSAGGDVLVWGRLLGIAHAGAEGDLKSKIAALQLRPLQLRIADKVARGPEETPEEGLAEEARIEKGRILISPAKTSALSAFKRGSEP